MIIRLIPSRLTKHINLLSAAPKPLKCLIELTRQIRHSSQSPNRVIFSGIQPTGVPHLGNYLGALQQWVQLQKEPPSNTRLLYCVVDLHAITVPQSPQQLQKWRRETLAALLAVGLDPDRCTIFFQSSVRRSLAAFQLKYCRFAERSTGTRTLRANVDSELYRLCRILVSYDAVEGLYPWLTLSRKVCGGIDRVSE